MKTTRGNLFFIALIFIVPMVGAWIFYHWHLSFAKPLNHGQLIASPPALSTFALKQLNGNDLNIAAKKWRILFVKPETCDRACDQQLYFLHQLITALGQDGQRVKNIVIVQPQNATSTHYPEMEVAVKNTQQQAFTLQQNNIYIADPLGNVILSYPAHANVEDVLKDLQLLLKASQTG